QDYAYAARSITNWQMQPYTLQSVAATLPAATTQTLTRRAYAISPVANCLPVTGDQDFGGPIRVRDLPEMTNPTRLVGSNAQGVLGSVVGQNNGDQLIWENGVWNTRPGPTGNGGGESAWLTSGDTLVYLPETRKVGIGVA